MLNMSGIRGRPYSPSQIGRQMTQSRMGTRKAEMMTIACAMGKSSVMVKSMRTW